jgi:DNA-binding XRE family transcriptional regulator
MSKKPVKPGPKKKSVPPPQPKHVPTKDNRDKVGLLTAFGVSQEGVAAELGINRETLVKYYSEDLARGLDRAIGRVGAKLFSTAMGNTPGATTAAIFFLKVKGGWREQIALTNNDGSDILSGIEHATDEQLKQLKEIYADIAKAAGSLTRRSDGGAPPDSAGGRKAANSR